MLKKHISILFTIALLAVFSACDKNPINKLSNPVSTVNTSSWTEPFVIYDDELKTRGDVVFLTSQEGQELNFNCYEYPASGSKCLKFAWDGSEVMDYSAAAKTFKWTGVGLSVHNSNDPNSGATKDITPGSYTKLAFKIKGAMNANVVFRLKFEANSTTTDVWTSSLADHEWHSVEFPISGSVATGIKYYVILVFEYFGSIQGNGGVVYIDDMKFIK